MTSSRTVLIAGVLVLGVAVSASARSLTLEAHAGLGGISRPGRWTPVRVTIDNSGADLSGLLVIAWGDAEIRRDVTIPSPSRKQIELYVRTSNVESAVRVRLVSNGIEVRAADAPVRLGGLSETMTLCVHPKGASDTTGESCDGRVSADMLPDAARAYDAFDRVIWLAGTRGVTASARDAFRRWQSVRALEESGSLSATAGVSRPLVPRGLADDSRRTVALGAAVYIAALLAAGLVCGARRGSTVAAYSGIALVACLGSSAALALGRVGPAKTVVVQHATLLQQLADGSGSAVSMRAIAELPAFDRFLLRVGAEDAFIEPSGVSHTKQHVYDEHGDAVLAGTFGLGSRQAFALEGFTAFQPIALSANGGRIRLTNRSAVPLRACRFADGLSVREVATLHPAQTVDAIQQVDEIAGPVVTCTVPELPFDFSETSHVVEARGTTRVAAYLQPRTRAAGDRETEP